MDDGSNNGSNITLNTHCFSNEEQEMVQDLFYRKFGIKTSLVKDRSKFKIAIGYNESPKFMEIVKSHIISSMSYKIVSPRNDLSNSTRQVAIL